MAKRPYAEVISETNLMVQGIRANQEVLAKRQINIEFADALQADVDLCTALNTEQETLKAKLKDKTAQLDAAMTTLTKKASESRKIIKLDIPQTLWREFGINDKR